VDLWSSGEGMPGIILLFVKAYEVFKNPLYRQVAEQYFKNIPVRPVHIDFTLQTGMAGLGELYLEAFRVFENNALKESAAWIAGLFANSFQIIEPGVGHWVVKNTDKITADLFRGNGGIIHFLTRYLFPSLSHPLTSTTKITC